jgi:hypothetical protein
MGGRFIRSGFWLLFLGFVMSFGMVMHYVVGAQYDTGPEFLRNVTLWYACPWTLSTAVVLGGALGMITIGTVNATLGKMAPAAGAGGSRDELALILCVIALIAMFLTGYVGYFIVDALFPTFYYAPVKDGKNLWLVMQLACMIVYGLGVLLAFQGIRRASAAVA